MNSIVELDRGPLEYLIVGEGKAVLVLNGGHTSCNTPFGHERFLVGQGCQLIIPSRPGYGKTSLSTGKSAEAFADVLAELLDCLQLDQVIVIGISGAGPTALQLAGRHPDRVSKLVLQNAVTGAKISGLRTQLGAWVIFNPWTEGWTWAAFRAFARFSPDRVLKVMLASLSSLAPAQVVATMSPTQKEEALAMLLSLRSGFLADFQHVCGDLGRITAPTLVIRSQYDGAISPVHASYAADHIREAELFITPAESHLLWFSQHNAQIEQKMAEFLEIGPGK